MLEFTIPFIWVKGKAWRLIIWQTRREMNLVTIQLIDNFRMIICNKMDCLHTKKLDNLIIGATSNFRGPSPRDGSLNLAPRRSFNTGSERVMYRL